MISNRKRKTKFKPATDGFPSIPDLGGCLFHTTAKGLWVKLLLSREKRCIGRTNCWNMWRGQRLRPPKTNVSPQKRDYFNRKYIFQSLIFRGHSFVFGCFFSDIFQRWKLSRFATETRLGLFSSLQFWTTRHLFLYFQAAFPWELGWLECCLTLWIPEKRN